MNDALLAARKALGMTHAMVARGAGIARNHYTQIEHGKRPGLEVALSIASVLNQPVEVLFGDILKVRDEPAAVND